MSGRIDLGRWLCIGLGACALAFALLWPFLPDPRERPWLELLGGGFVYNYRVADVYIGFTARPNRPVEVGSVLEATFENPAGGEPFVVERRLGLPDRRISMRSPPMRGVRKGVPYAVKLRLLAREDRTPLWTHEYAVTAMLDDDVVPDAPLTVGPGYHRAPASTRSSTSPAR